MTQLTKERIGGLALLTFSAAYAWLGQDIRVMPFQQNAPFHDRSFPDFLAIVGISLSLLLVVTPSSGDAPNFRGYRWGLGVAFLALMSMYGLFVRPAGFLIATSVFLIVGFVMLGERRPLVVLGASLPLVAGFWALMAEVLDVYVAPWPDPAAFARLFGMGG